MRTLILGADGQVGRALAVSAPAAAEVLTLGRDECDLAVPGAAAAVIAKLRPTLVFNAAGYTAVDHAEREPELAGRVNAEAPGEIAASACSAGARVVHLSTDFVFDGTTTTPRRPSDPMHPLNVYGRSKRDGELAVLAAAPDALIVRTAWIYAAHGSNFVNTMLCLLAEREEIRVVADQIGTPTHAASLARALWTLAGAHTRGIHHFTDAGVASWYDFAVAIAEEGEALGILDTRARIVPIATADYATPARRPAFSVLDKSETWALLGGPPQHWRAALRTCLVELKPA